MNKPIKQEWDYEICRKCRREACRNCDDFNDENNKTIDDYEAYHEEYKKKLLNDIRAIWNESFLVEETTRLLFPVIFKEAGKVFKEIEERIGKGTK